MTDDRFWELVDATAAYRADPERQLAALRAELDKLPAEEIAAFDAAFGRQVARAYRWDLWGAAYVANGGASDDGFLYFRLWLVSKGWRVFERVLKDPDSLADLDAAPGPDGVYEFEAIGYVAREALAAKRGGDGGGLPGEEIGGLEPSGRPFSEEPASLAAAYPRLWRKFGQHPMVGD